jgi:hypothetical protein
MKRFFKISLFVILGVFCVTGNSMAIPTIDGTFNLSEWAGYYAEDDGVRYYDGFVNPGWGGQNFDVEYLGLYITSDEVYFGLQTGFDVAAADVSGYRPGDFALDVNGDGTYDYAIDFSISETTASFSLYDVTSWKDSDYFSTANPFEMGEYKHVADFTGAFGSGEYANNIDGGTSYVLEGSFDLILLDAYTGNDIGIHWTMQCGNDYLNQTSAPVPEPATMLLFGCGLIGLATVGRKKFQKAITT